jgi:ABC-type Mn2+/Zn2+ transport system ATPase subunit
MVGQDATSLELILNAILKRFTDKGETLIFTSHDPGVAAVLNPQIMGLFRVLYAARKVIQTFSSCEATSSHLKCS